MNLTIFNNLNQFKKGYHWTDSQTEFLKMQLYAVSGKM